MVKEEEEEIMEAGGGSCGYMEYTMLGVGEEDYFLTSPPSYFSYTTSSTTTTSPTCSSYLSFYGEEHQDALAFHYATTSPISSKPHNKKGRGGDQRSKHAAAATATKKPRVRKERLGERIVALQQLVSPFGKSDTASVLHEALGYIRFLHEQVKVLSSPYMQRLQTCVPHIPKLVDTAGATVEPRPGDLRSRGLCLVPVSCTEHVAGSSNGADLWSAAAAENKACATAFRINHLSERN